MKELVALTALVALALTGCASGPEPEPTQTQRSDANSSACEGFVAETRSMVEQFDGTGALDFDAHLAALDTLALEAEGDVKERISEFLEELPTEGDLLVYPDARESYNELALSVARACDASGTDIDVAGFGT